MRMPRTAFRIASIAVLFLAGVSSNALAFKQKFHEQITEAILKAQGFDDDSADQVGDANWYTDVFESSSDAAHADNNQLAAASARLRSKRTAIGDALNACQRRDALNALGQALHTTQDIFSHSNSIDNGIPVPDLLGLANGTAACSLPNFAPGGLVTGYFSIGGFFTGNQCRGLPAGMCCHRDLNKDAPGEANGARHGAALDRARTATTDYVSLVEDDIRARFGEPKATQLLKMLKKKQRTTYFVIDDTGSMGDDIAGVQAAVNRFLDDIIAGDEAPTLGLASFKDNVNDRGVTCDIENLRAQVNALFASGGDDCPEASNSGMLAALSHFPLIGSDMQLRGGRLLLATDASAGDASLGPTVAIQAALKGVSIDAILTGDCQEETFAGAAPSAAATRPSANEPGALTALAPSPALAATGDPLTSPSARTQLRALTQITGGVLFNVARVEVDDVVPTLLELSKPDTTVVLVRQMTLTAGTPVAFDVPVDDTLGTSVTFMVTASQAAPLPTFTLRRPDGSSVTPGDPGVTRRTLSSVDSIAIATPAVGRWQAQFDGAGVFFLRVFGSTPFRLDSVRLQARVTVPSRPELDFEPLSGQPVVGANLVTDLRFTTAPGSVAAASLRPDGTLIQTLAPLEALDGVRRFRADLTVPGERFIVETTGRTAAGAEFVRDVTVPADPQTVAVEVSPVASSARPGTEAPVTVRVRNAGTADATYRLQALSSLGWTVTGPGTLAVTAGAVAEASFTVLVPADAAEGTTNTLTFLVEDVAAPSVRNSASATVIAAALNRPPTCTGATADPATLFPANHKLNSIGILGVTDPDSDALTLTVNTITQDEPVCGGPKPEPDGTGVGTATPRVRAERNNHGDGRVYEIGFTASDGSGASCTGSVRVEVPRHRNVPAVDSGQRFDSTVVPPQDHHCDDDDD
jgi:hypothetical protein